MRKRCALCEGTFHVLILNDLNFKFCFWQMQSEQNVDFMMGWLPLFAVNPPTEKEVKACNAPPPEKKKTIRVSSTNLPGKLDPAVERPQAM